MWHECETTFIIKTHQLYLHLVSPLPALLLDLTALPDTKSMCCRGC